MRNKIKEFLVNNGASSELVEKLEALKLCRKTDILLKTIWSEIGSPSPVQIKLAKISKVLGAVK